MTSLWITVKGFWNSFLDLFGSPTDTEHDQRRKKCIISISLISLCVDLMTVGSWFAFQWLNIALWIAFCSSTTMITNIYLTKKLTDPKIGIFTILIVFCLLAGDWTSARLMHTRIWPVVIIFADMLLICNVPHSYTKTLIWSMVLYLCIDELEKVFRFGLYDPPYSDTYEGRAICDCEIPPCAIPISTGIVDVSLACSVFLVDFAVTRGFAEGVLREEKKLRASSEVTEKVVKCMVRFDLELAEEILLQVSETEMTGVLLQLLSNLKVYRPFLPTALFEFEDRLSTEIPVPGISGEEVAIVFTDIKSSSLCWEAAPEAMARALRIHNSVIGQCIGDFDGYEVKTIGDSFMVSFSSIVNACSFGLNVHLKLLETSWPPDLLLVPICMPDNSGEWNGLRVRIGIAWGDAVVESQRTSNKVDYFGPIVNLAARIENACVPGSVSISEPAYNELSKINKSMSDLLSAKCIEMSSVNLRGIGIRTLWALVPSCLPLRCESVFNEVRGVLPEDEKSTSTSLNSLLMMTTVSETLSKRSFDESNLSKHFISVGHISVATGDDIAVNMNQGLQRIITSLERTSGIVISLVGNSIIAGWNVSGRHDNHVECCFKFVHFISRYGTSEFTVGVSNGSVNYGRIGAVGQRFVAAIGPCVPLSQSLCSAAKELGVCCLYGSTDSILSRETSRMFSHALRPVDEWTDLILYGRLTITLYEVNTKALIPEINDLEQQETPNWEWSDDYWKAFHSNDVSSIAVAATDNLVLSKILEQLSEGSHLTHSIILQ